MAEHSAHGHGLTGRQLARADAEAKGYPSRQPASLLQRFCCGTSKEEALGGPSEPAQPHLKSPAPRSAAENPPLGIRGAERRRPRPLPLGPECIPPPAASFGGIPWSSSSWGPAWASWRRSRRHRESRGGRRASAQWTRPPAGWVERNKAAQPRSLGRAEGAAEGADAREREALEGA